MRFKLCLLCSILIVSVFSIQMQQDQSGIVLLVPQQYPTIQAGIDAARDGDVVVVATGTYTGDGQHITLQQLAALASRQ